MHGLKSQPIFSEASQTECCELFNFPTGISGFQYVNICKYPWLPFLSAPHPRVSFRVPLARFLSRYPPNGELYCRLNEGDIGRYQIPQENMANTENHLNTDTAYFN